MKASGQKPPLPLWSGELAPLLTERRVRLNTLMLRMLVSLSPVEEVAAQLLTLLTEVVGQPGHSAAKEELGRVPY